ncbi:hypothetical protein IAU59_000418 [Kwoniella sp. CBS 9459]
MTSDPKPYAIPAPQISPTSFKSTSRMMPPVAMNEDSTGAKMAETHSFFHSKKSGITFLAMYLNVMLFGLDQFIFSVAVHGLILD